jgi:hypothetical protein
VARALLQRQAERNNQGAETPDPRVSFDRGLIEDKVMKILRGIAASLAFALVTVAAGGTALAYPGWHPHQGGGCNQYGCWNTPWGSCNQYGCRDVGGCNQYGCWNTPRGGCNQYGCWR